MTLTPTPLPPPPPHLPTPPLVWTSGNPIKSLFDATISYRVRALPSFEQLGKTGSIGAFDVSISRQDGGRGGGGLPSFAGDGKKVPTVNGEVVGGGGGWGGGWGLLLLLLMLLVFPWRCILPAVGGSVGGGWLQRKPGKNGGKTEKKGNALFVDFGPFFSFPPPPQLAAFQQFLLRSFFRVFGPFFLCVCVCVCVCV